MVAAILACAPGAVRLQKELIVRWRESDLADARCGPASTPSPPPTPPASRARARPPSSRSARRASESRAEGPDGHDRLLGHAAARPPVQRQPLQAAAHGRLRDDPGRHRRDGERGRARPRLRGSPAPTSAASGRRTRTCPSSSTCAPSSPRSIATCRAACRPTRSPALLDAYARPALLVPPAVDAGARAGARAPARRRA